MGFTDTSTVNDLNLRDQVRIQDDEREWVTGVVVELSLLGGDGTTVQILLRTPTGSLIVLNRTPDTLVIYEW